jgi:hypothetical protein
VQKENEINEKNRMISKLRDWISRTEFDINELRASLKIDVLEEELDVIIQKNEDLYEPKRKL